MPEPLRMEQKQFPPGVTPRSASVRSLDRRLPRPYYVLGIVHGHEPCPVLASAEPLVRATPLHVWRAPSTFEGAPSKLGAGGWW